MWAHVHRHRLVHALALGAQHVHDFEPVDNRQLMHKVVPLDRLNKPVVSVAWQEQQCGLERGQGGDIIIKMTVMCAWRGSDAW
jgi:hypothetical protein